MFECLAYTGLRIGEALGCGGVTWTSKPTHEHLPAAVALREFSQLLDRRDTKRLPKPLGVRARGG